MPLTFDMPWDELQTYRGCNPRPADFDAYWERGLAEMRALDPQIEITAADFQTPYAECSHMYFTGVGGARIHAKLVRPRHGTAPHPAICQFHGYSIDSGDWTAKMPYVAMGYTVAALDSRGQGGLSEDKGGVKGWTLRGHIVRGLDEENPDKLLFRQDFLDTAQLARIVMQMPDVDPERVGAMGGSQGGALTLACASLEPGIKRAVPMYPFLCDYKRVWDIDLAKDAYAELREYFRRRDPLHQREGEIFTTLGYIDVQHLVPRIRGEVLMAVGLMDQICPPSSQFAAYNKITARKSLSVYPDFAHEDLPGHADRAFQFMAQL